MLALNHGAGYSTNLKSGRRSGGEVTKMLLPTGCWTENAADVTKEYKVHIEAKMVEIRGFLTDTQRP